MGELDNKKKKKFHIDIYSYDFEKLIKGRKGEIITKYLAELPLTSPIFESTTIQAYMDFQWQTFRWKFFFIIFLYIVSFLLMFPYFELFKIAMSDIDNDEALPFGQLLRNHWIFFFMVLPI